MQFLTQALVTFAETVWIIPLALGATLVAFRVLRRIDKQFRLATAGHEVFDFQNRLTLPQMETQLSSYSPASKRLYTRFFIADFFFPLIASVFLALLWAYILNRPDPLLFRQLLTLNLPLLTFAATLFDWGENVSFLIVIGRHPHWLSRLAAIGLLFKRLKLISLVVIAIVTWGLIGIAVLSILIELIT